MRILVTAASRHGATQEIADAIAAGLERRGVDAGVDAVGAEDHRVFAGRLDRKLLLFGEKAVVVAVRAPEGDFRDWEAIDGFAGEIAGHLERG